MTDKPGGAGRAVLLGVAVAVLALCVFQTVWAWRMKTTLQSVDASLARLARAENTLDHLEEKVDNMAADQSITSGDTEKLSRKIDDLKRSLERRDRANDVEAPPPPEIDWTQPFLFEKAKSSAAEYGIELRDDEVRVPARLVVRQGPVEYFAVLKGGKEHETLVALVGNVPKGERRPKDFGARFNNALQALGFKRGRPARFTQSGVVPPKGDTAHLFVEWQDKGATVLARAEDLVWDRLNERAMERGKWVYVGSQFLVGEDPSLPVFAADASAEVASTYNQSPDVIFDNGAEGAADDQKYIVATPRLPLDVDDCTFIVRRKDRADAHVFPDPTTGDGDAKPDEKDDGTKRR
jgi:hypothetical protein